MRGSTRVVVLLLGGALSTGSALGTEDGQFGTPKDGDTSPWDHLDYAGRHLFPVRSTIDIDVSELTNTGHVRAEFEEGADHLASRSGGVDEARLKRELRSRVKDVNYPSCVTVRGVPNGIKRPLQH